MDASLVDELVDEAQACKARIVKAQQDIEAAQAQIKVDRSRLKAINPVIALYDGDTVELPQLDMRRNGGHKPAPGSDEALAASRAKVKRKQPKRKGSAMARNAGKKAAGAKKTAQTKPAVRWQLYPDTCLLPAAYHHTGQSQQHIGRGLCNAHVQRLRLGSMPEEEFAEYVDAAQKFAEYNGFTLTEDELRLT